MCWVKGNCFANLTPTAWLPSMKAVTSPQQCLRVLLPHMCSNTEWWQSVWQFDTYRVILHGGFNLDFYIVNEVLHLSYMFVYVSEFSFPCTVCTVHLLFFNCIMTIFLLIEGGFPGGASDWNSSAEDEMVRWHPQLNGHEFEQVPGGSNGQGSLGYCSP